MADVGTIGDLNGKRSRRLDGKEIASQSAYATTEQLQLEHF